MNGSNSSRGIDQPFDCGQDSWRRQTAMFFLRPQKKVWCGADARAVPFVVAGRRTIFAVHPDVPKGAFFKSQTLDHSLENLVESGSIGVTHWRRWTLVFLWSAVKSFARRRSTNGAKPTSRYGTDGLSKAVYTDSKSRT